MLHCNFLLGIALRLWFPDPYDRVLEGAERDCAFISVVTLTFLLPLYRNVIVRNFHFKEVLLGTLNCLRWVFFFNEILMADHKIIGTLVHSDYFWTEETRGSLGCGHHPSSGVYTNGLSMTVACWASISVRGSWGFS